MMSHKLDDFIVQASVLVDDHLISKAMVLVRCRHTDCS